MKKIFVFTSLLALAACGGGSGGGHHGGGAAILPDDSNTGNEFVGGNIADNNGDNQPENNGGNTGDESGNTGADDNAGGESGDNTGDDGDNDNPTVDDTNPDNPTLDNPGTDEPTPDTPVIDDVVVPDNNVDLIITSMPESVDNKSEIVAYAESVLADVSVARSRATSGDTRRADRRAASIWGNVGADDKYSLALAEYKNMYNVALGQKVADDAFLHAYLLAGGRVADYEWADLDDAARDEIAQYIHSRYEEILRRFFGWIGDVPSWEYKKQNLADMQLHTVGDREFGWGNTHVKISQTTNGRVEKIILVDNNDDGIDRYVPTEYNLVARDGKYQSQTIYVYELPYKTEYGTYAISFGSDHELTTAEVQQKFREEAYGDEKLLALIDGLTDGDKTLSSSYDVDDRYTDADVGKYFVSPRNLTMNLEVYGKQAGLQFSDFGKISGKFNVGDKSYDRSYLFAGGYDIKSVDKENMHGEMKFHGNAVAQVMHHYSDNDGTEQTYLDLASTADLVFKDGAETLTMNFADNENPQNRWYNVRFESDANGETAKMHLTDGDKIAAENAKYKFTGADTSRTYELTATDMDGCDQSNMKFYDSENTDFSKQHLEEAGFQTAYYGDNGTSSEVVGKVSLLQQDWSDDPDTEYNNEVYFFGVFGGKKE